MSLPLCYCTNVHPCRSAAEVETVLDAHVLPVRQRAGFDIAVGLWLPAAAVAETLATPTAQNRLRQQLDARRLTCHTLNAFPFGDFHVSRVKEQVYLPDWSDPRRLAYTLDCGRLLAGLLPDGVDGSISTLPLGFKQSVRSPGFDAAVIARLLGAAAGLALIRDETGRTIRLAIEPEPFCLLETTAETVAFFTQLWTAADAAGQGRVAREHLGVCYDVCHQAVEFEDASEAIGGLQAAGIRINKMQISCAIQLDDPSDEGARAALAAFAEPRYLHQTMALTADGRILREVDLTPALTEDPAPEWRTARTWRTHFHVPVDAERLGPLGTTRQELRRALAAIGRLDYRPHLEVETYTWPVLPGAAPADIVEGLARELVATRDLLGQPA